MFLRAKCFALSGVPGFFRNSPRIDTVARPDADGNVPAAAEGVILESDAVTAMADFFSPLISEWNPKKPFSGEEAAISAHTYGKKVDPDAKAGCMRCCDLVLLCA